MRQVAEARSGTLASGQSLVLATDGAWDVVFGADGAKQVHRVYGVNVTMPQVTILTESDAPFVNGSLDVTASTTSGTLYHGTDGEHWTAGSVATITRTATSRTLQAHDWGAKAPVEAVAQVDEPRGGGAMRSSEFSEAGRGAIKKAGATQIRLPFERRPDAPGNYAFINGETAQHTRLHRRSPPACPSAKRKRSDRPGGRSSRASKRSSGVSINAWRAFSRRSRFSCAIGLQVVRGA